MRPQANSAPLDLQDADVANTDASLKALQGKGINNPATLAVQAGKPVSIAAQAPLKAFQNLLVVGPQSLPYLASKFLDLTAGCAMFSWHAP